MVRPPCDHLLQSFVEAILVIFYRLSRLKCLLGDDSSLPLSCETSAVASAPQSAKTAAFVEWTVIKVAHSGHTPSPRPLETHGSG